MYYLLLLGHGGPLSVWQLSGALCRETGIFLLWCKRPSWPHRRELVQYVRIGSTTATGHGAAATVATGAAIAIAALLRPAIAAAALLRPAAIAAATLAWQGGSGLGRG